MLFIVCSLSSPLFWGGGVAIFPLRPASKRETISKRKLVGEKMKQKGKKIVRTYSNSAIAERDWASVARGNVAGVLKVTIPKVLRTLFVIILVLIRILNSSTGKGYVAMQIYSRPEY